MRALPSATKKKTITLAVLLCIGILSCIHPLYPHDMFLQHAATVIIMGLLAYDIRVGFLSYRAFLGISLFVLLHITGARYVYSFVPYNDWSVSVFGWDINAYFGFRRNHYDRVVHFLFGILIFPFLVELFGKKGGLSLKMSVLLAWLGIQTFSMLYEIFEWLLTLMLSGNAAENYNGQQGDMWDAHKDMALAMVGSTLAALVYRAGRKWRNG